MKIAVYTFVTWESALAVLRYRGTTPYSDLEFFQGSNQRMEYTLEPLEDADLVLIQRDFPVYLEAYQQVLEQARARSLPVVYETDDLLFKLPPEHPDTAIHFYTLALLPILRAAIEADAVTVSTAALVDSLQPLHPDVRLLPNYLPDHLWPLQPVRRLADPSSKVTIGYLGSTSHAPDLQMIEPALQDLLDRYPQAALHFWGCPPPPGLAAHERVDYTPLMIYDYQEYGQYCASLELDIALAPLRDSPFNHSKSPIKFYEYSALGLPGVYSDVSAYNQAVIDGENGLLAGDLQGWYERLSALIENPELRSRLAHKAQDDLRRNWLVSTQAQQWQQAYTEILAAPRRRVPAQVPLPSSLLFDLIDQITRYARSLQHQLADSQERQDRLTAELESYQHNPLVRLLSRLRG